jgi:hypothetical protein
MLIYLSQQQQRTIARRVAEYLSLPIGSVNMVLNKVSCQGMPISTIKPSGIESNNCDNSNFTASRKASPSSVSGFHMYPFLRYLLQFRAIARIVIFQLSVRILSTIQQPLQPVVISSLSVVISHLV